MRILSGLAGKMAPVAGPRGKAVPTAPAAFTPVQHRVTPVSQRRREHSRGTEVQQQTGTPTTTTTTTTMAAPHSGSVKSDPGRGNKSCSSCSSSSPSPSYAGGGTSESCTMGRDTGVQVSTSCRDTPRDPGEAGPGRNGRGTHVWQSTSCMCTSTDCKGSDPNRKCRGSEQYPAVASRSRVRHYRKRVCVRWGSLQWSLDVVVVVRSAAAAGCQGAPHHHAVATGRPLTVA